MKIFRKVIGWSILIGIAGGIILFLCISSYNSIGWEGVGIILGTFAGIIVFILLTKLAIDLINNNE